jgi:hypothetical protein
MRKFGNQTMDFLNDIIWKAKERESCGVDCPECGIWWEDPHGPPKGCGTCKLTGIHPIPLTEFYE